MAGGPVRPAEPTRPQEGPGVEPTPDDGTRLSAEDVALFPYLRVREGGLAPVLDRLQPEHRIIHDVLDSVDRALVNFIAEPGDVTELQEAADLLTDTLLSHLAYEERELIDPLARHGFYSYGDDA